jgi:hypothetical protein
MTEYCQTGQQDPVNPLHSSAEEDIETYLVMLHCSHFIPFDAFFFEYAAEN